MDEQRAKLLLGEIFKNSFDNDNFVRFIKELFNKFDYSKKNAEQEEIPKDFQEFIDSYSLFGRYEDSERKSIEVLAVKLKKNNPEFARTMQRNFVAKYLAQRNADAALVAFYGDEIDNWRFSFVKLEYHLEKDEKGDVKPAKSLTPPKRYSFLVGKTEPSHTAQSRFLELLMKEDSGLTVSEIESSFSVEKVTKEFFEKYKELFLELEESLNKIVKQNRDIAKEFNDKGISTIDFAKKLIGQIVFIYFLQKKGWLGIEKDEAGKFGEWGTGHKDFLKKLYNKDIVSYDNFFNDILEPLFYEALARDRTIDNDYYGKFRCKIPFLNGGLFEPLGGYDWTNMDILLDNKIFGKIIETFDLYNFTVKEDEPLEKEVAIDPEMLGKVFENLLEIKDRKSKGSYYTPREIVYYMCQESLINYLETRTGIEKKNIDDLIYNGQISNQIRDNSDKIDKLLKDIKVVDPAIGSGAFPVGMMAEIIKVRATLTELFPKDEQLERTLYNFKRECIEDSLYGVDIDPGAIDIAQLRLWLSLIVDEADIHKIKPLPNLDYKIMCGNSLLDEFEGIKLFDERLLGGTQKIDYLEVNNIEEMIKRLYKELGEILNGNKKDSGRSRAIKKEIKKLKRKKQELLSEPKKEGTNSILFDDKKIKESQEKLKEIRDLHKLFFNENNRKNKIELRKEIEKRDWEFIEESLKEQGNEEAIKKLEQIKKTRSKPFFLWKLYFSDVFQENRGFDVIIGNPPYSFTRDADFTDLVKEYANEHYFKGLDSVSKSHARQSGKINLYSLFLIRGIQLLKEHGVLGFIIPNNLLRTTTYDIIREYILKNCKIIQIVDLGAGVFENATVATTIIILQEEKSQIKRNRNKVSIIYDVVNFDLSNKKYKTHLVGQNEFLDNTSHAFNITSDKEATELLNMLDKKSKPLGDITTIHAGGIATGSNKKEMILDYPKNSKYKPMLEGKDIKPFLAEFSNRYILYDREKLRRARNENIFLSPEKVITQRIGGGKRVIVASYDNKQYYTFNSTNSILQKDKEYSLKYITALLNSNLLNYYYVNKFTNESTLTVNISKTFLENLPIKNANESQQKPFIKLVDEILELSKMKNKDYNTNSGIENRDKIESKKEAINELVYDLYGLTEAQKKLVKDWVEV